MATFLVSETLNALNLDLEGGPDVLSSRPKALAFNDEGGISYPGQEAAPRSPGSNVHKKKLKRVASQGTMAATDALEAALALEESLVKVSEEHMAGQEDCGRRSSLSKLDQRRIDAFSTAGLLASAQGEEVAELQARVVCLEDENRRYRELARDLESGMAEDSEALEALGELQRDNLKLRSTLERLGVGVEGEEASESWAEQVKEKNIDKVEMKKPDEEKQAETEAACSGEKKGTVIITTCLNHHPLIGTGESSWDYVAQSMSMMKQELGQLSDALASTRFVPLEIDSSGCGL